CARAGGAGLTGGLGAAGRPPPAAGRAGRPVPAGGVVGPGGGLLPDGDRSRAYRSRAALPRAAAQVPSLRQDGGMRIALAHLTSTVDPAENLDLVREYTARAASTGAELVVFPEAMQCSFARPRIEAAEAWDGPWATGVR